MTENNAIPKYPETTIWLSSLIVSMVREALSDMWVHPTVIDEFTKDATSGDLDHLIETAKRWVTIK